MPPKEAPPKPETNKELTGKESKLYKEMSRLYDNQEYKKCMTKCDEILAVRPIHADTMAMRALALHSANEKDNKTGKADERAKAVEECRQAIKYDMRSTIAWHSLALMLKADEEYAEAMKALKMACRLDPENQSLLRELASCSAALRDWESFFDARNKALALKSAIQSNWLGVAVGHVMLKRYDLAAHVLDVMGQILDPYEEAPARSEVALFHAEIHLFAGNAAACLALLKEHDKIILDNQERLSLKARAFEKLGNKDKAADCLKAMIKEGWGVGDCVEDLARLKGIKFDPTTKMPQDDKANAAYVTLLQDLIKEFPKESHFQRTLLDVCPLAEFKQLLADYCVRFVAKNVPALFSILKSLYKLEVERVNMIGEVFSEWEKKIEAGDVALWGAEPSGPKSNPTLILWVWTYLATHYSRTGDFPQARSYIDKAIVHSPTVELLYMYKAKILRREGGHEDEAADAADIGRQLDLQDKFMNSTAVKYWLRAGNVKKAEETLGLFYSRPNDVDNHYLQAYESQTLWFERSLGRALYEKGDYYGALQNLLLQEKHRQDDNASTTDFGGYVLRIGRCRSWVDMMSRDIIDTSSKFYLQFAPWIVRSYLKVSELGAEKVMAAHSPRPSPAPTPAPPGAKENPEDQDQAELDRRYNAFVLKVDLENPLDKCKTYVNALIAHRANDPDSHEVAYQYYRAKGQPLGCVRALQNLQRIKDKLLSGKDKKAATTFLAALSSEFKTWNSSAEGKAWPDAVKSLTKEFA